MYTKRCSTSLTIREMEIKTTVKNHLNLLEQYMHACVLNHVQLFVIPWTVACQVPLSLEFFRQECWNRLPFPTPEDLPDPGIEPASLESPALAGGFFITLSPGKPHLLDWLHSKRQEVSTGEDVSKREPLCTVSGNINRCSHYWIQYGGPSKNQK